MYSDFGNGNIPLQDYSLPSRDDNTRAKCHFLAIDYFLWLPVLMFCVGAYSYHVFPELDTDLRIIP